MNSKPTEFLLSLRRINPNETNQNFSETVFLFPKDASAEYLNDGKIRTKGLPIELDKKERDLLTMIRIRNATAVDYELTKVLMPRTYAESLSPIPPHMSVQCLILSRMDIESKSDLLNLIHSTFYGKTPYDRIWLESTPPEQCLLPGEIIYITNRRVGGWDGSRERPVIELLGAGGHIPTKWRDNDQGFIPVAPLDTVQEEIKQELGAVINKNAVKILGGFHNHTSNELVILCCVFIHPASIIDIQKKASGNLGEDVDGIYLGRFDQVLAMYQADASGFAGGERTKPSNFPSQPKLMEIVRNSIK